jgi:murein DD-endopeptidase MepM/ murein hydrolase activator NlpD
MRYYLEHNMDETFEKIISFLNELKFFFTELGNYLIKNFHLSYLTFEEGKGIFVTALYRQRGKMARRLIHTGMAAVAGVGMMIAPVIAQEFPGRSVNPWDIPSASAVLSAYTEGDAETSTLVSDKIRDKAIEYAVQPGDTVGSIAEKFGISQDTIRWQNNLKSKDSIKVGQVLEILPVTGISHKVQKGDTVYSIAKRYDSGAQAIVDFPYNTFANDETFELAIGQTVIVPDGVKPAEVLWSPLASVRQITPNAGTVVASGNFVWPAGGTITQRFVWYHPGIDIANKAAPAILAADAGTVVIAGWIDNGGYGNRVMIDHGNGYRTLYAHLSSIYVVPGQTVRRGDSIGKMGSTGRSTGIHLHFEVSLNGSRLNPLNVLR